MKLNFDYKGTKITYYLTYKRTNAIAINVDADGKVNVIAPIGTSVYAVMDKVKGNAPWIINEVYKHAKGQEKVKLLDQYTYLGKNYGLEIIKTEEAEVIKVKMARGKFVVETNTEAPIAIRSAILEWYKQKVKAKLKERLKAYKEVFEKLPSHIEVADDHTVLFKANEDGLFANVKIGILSPEVIDYMLVSSLCVINYSEEGQVTQKLEEILPNYEKSKEWLEENKNNLML